MEVMFLYIIQSDKSPILVVWICMYILVPWATTQKTIPNDTLKSNVSKSRYNPETCEYS